jgi:hypothetical protein
MSTEKENINLSQQIKIYEEMKKKGLVSEYNLISPFSRASERILSQRDEFCFSHYENRRNRMD